MPEDILSKLRKEIIAVKDVKSLYKIKSDYLGKNGIITLQLKNISKLSDEDKKAYGKKLNIMRQDANNDIDEKLLEIQKLEEETLIANEKIDVTLPSRRKHVGTIHPVSHTIEALLCIFSAFNFKIAEGPNIEDDWHNFTALNIGPNHPARQMHDTFYLGKNIRNQQLMLRTHTSNVQIRAIEKMNKPPIYLVAPGRTYRSDSDATHTPMFHQMEGIVIDTEVHMGNLKYLIVNFIKKFFESEDIEIMFRPSFFPFTEPSAEVDIKCPKTGRWMEVLGCGMIHPNVFKNVNIDYNKYQGFAFGLGIERLAMLKYSISDLRNFFTNDQRWLQHYSFSAFDIPTILGGVSK